LKNKLRKQTRKQTQKEGTLKEKKMERKRHINTSTIQMIPMFGHVFRKKTEKKEEDEKQ
jgi:hypothetical protein